jgi:hypothetical protein
MIRKYGVIWNKKTRGEDEADMVTIKYEYFLMVIVVHKTESNIKSSGGRKWVGSKVICHMCVDYTEFPVESKLFIPKMAGLNRRNCDELNTIMHIIQRFVHTK